MGPTGGTRRNSRVPGLAGFRLRYRYDDSCRWRLCDPLKHPRESKPSLCKRVREELSSRHATARLWYGSGHAVLPGRRCRRKCPAQSGRMAGRIGHRFPHSLRHHGNDIRGDDTGVLARDAVCLLDVPTHKTGSAFTKPVDPLLGHAIEAWQAIRPDQPRMLDRKTSENVDFLFAIRARRAGKHYINEGIIPMLCRKAGVPAADVRGTITSHRARSTIASQLYNAKEPMTLFELQAWLEIAADLQDPAIPAADGRATIPSHRARSTIASQLYNAKEPMTLFELQAWL